MTIYTQMDILDFKMVKFRAWTTFLSLEDFIVAYGILCFRSKAIKKVRNVLSFSQTKSSEDKQSLFSRSRGSSLEEMFNNNSISWVNIVKIMGS